MYTFNNMPVLCTKLILYTAIYLGKSTKIEHHVHVHYPQTSNKPNSSSWNKLLLTK